MKFLGKTSKHACWAWGGLALIVMPLGSAETGLQGSSSLNGAKLEPARLQTSKLEPARLQPAQRPQKRPALKKVSLDVVRNGLTADKIQGAVSSIPTSSMGEFFFDVAGELERMEGEVTSTAVGYYMAALTDPKGRRYNDAKRRLLELILQDGLPQEQAANLYDGGLATFGELSKLKVGMTPKGVESSLRDLVQIKAAYQKRLALNSPARDAEEE